MIAAERPLQFTIGPDLKGGFFRECRRYCDYRSGCCYGHCFDRQLQKGKEAESS